MAAALLGERRGGLLTRLDALVAPTAGHDLVSGAAGAGVCLLLRPPSPDREAALARALARGARSDPPFPVPRHRIPAGWAVRDGYADCGLAHGAAGPLAVLSLLAGRSAAAAEIARPAVARLAGWLLDVAHRDEWGTSWPAGVAGDERYPSPRRASWCYAVPGIARALWPAGEALDEPAYRPAAQEAMDELPAAREAWGLDGLGVCHGLAGLMLLTASFAPVEALFDDLCAAYGSRPVEDSGLLSGAAGIALALLAVTHGTPSTPFLAR